MREDTRCCFFFYSFSSSLHTPPIPLLAIRVLMQVQTLDQDPLVRISLFWLYSGLRVAMLLSYLLLPSHLENHKWQCSGISFSCWVHFSILSVTTDTIPSSSSLFLVQSVAVIEFWHLYLNLGFLLKILFKSPFLFFSSKKNKKIRSIT